MLYEIVFIYPVSRHYSSKIANCGYDIHIEAPSEDVVKGPLETFRHGKAYPASHFLAELA